MNEMKEETGCVAARATNAAALNEFLFFSFFSPCVCPCAVVFVVCLIAPGAKGVVANRHPWLRCARWLFRACILSFPPPLCLAVFTRPHVVSLRVLCTPRVLV